MQDSPVFAHVFFLDRLALAIHLNTSAKVKEMTNKKYCMILEYNIIQ